MDWFLCGNGLRHERVNDTCNWAQRYDLSYITKCGSGTLRRFQYIDSFPEVKQRPQVLPESVTSVSKDALKSALLLEVSFGL